MSSGRPGKNIPNLQETPEGHSKLFSLLQQELLHPHNASGVAFYVFEKHDIVYVTACQIRDPMHGERGLGLGP